jgi:hypothetical protein
MAQHPRTRRDAAAEATRGEPPEPTHDPTDPGTHDPGDAVPEGVPGPGSAVGDDWAGVERRPDRDPGDAVPEGVAPAEPAPLTEEDRRILKRLEDLPKRAQEGGG